jgi:class 3 adenylate cyclase
VSGSAAIAARISRTQQRLRKHVTPHAYTRKHLAQKILTCRSALEGERKQVTVLFADVKGSMDLAEQVDPEVRQSGVEKCWLFRNRRRT